MCHSQHQASTEEATQLLECTLMETQPTESIPGSVE